MPVSQISFLSKSRFTFWLWGFASLYCAPSCLSITPPIVAPSSIEEANVTRENKETNLSISPKQPFMINLGNTSVALPKKEQRQPILMTFFTPNCEPCGRLTRSINQLQALLSKDELDLYGVCIAPRGCLLLREFISNYQPLYPIGYTELAFQTKTNTKVGPFGPIIAVPTTYLISSSGKLIESFNGSLPIQYVIKLIRQQQVTHD